MRFGSLSFLMYLFMLVCYIYTCFFHVIFSEVPLCSDNMVINKMQDYHRGNGGALSCIMSMVGI